MTLPLSKHNLLSAPRLSDKFLTFYFRTGLRGFQLMYKLREKFGGATNIRFQSRYGAIYDLNPYDYIEGFVLRYGFYESEVFEALWSYITQPSAVLWDVGSNFGLHAIAAKVVSPGTTVYAFEPVPELLDSICANSRLNGVSVTTVPVALSDKSGQRALYVPCGWNTGRASIYPIQDIPDTATIQVMCARADELIRSGHVLSPTVIKLDVEGAEAEVLDSLGSYIEQPQLQAIVFEGHSGLTSQSVNDPVAALLDRAGFQIKTLERQEPSHHALENYLAWRQ